MRRAALRRVNQVALDLKNGIRPDSFMDYLDLERSLAKYKEELEGRIVSGYREYNGPDARTHRVLMNLAIGLAGHAGVRPRTLQEVLAEFAQLVGIEITVPIRRHISMSVITGLVNQPNRVLSYGRPPSHYIPKLPTATHRLA
jgi:hypothetical protein